MTMLNVFHFLRRIGLPNERVYAARFPNLVSVMRTQTQLVVRVGRVHPWHLQRMDCQHHTASHGWIAGRGGCWGGSGIRGISGDLECSKGGAAHWM